MGVINSQIPEEFVKWADSLEKQVAGMHGHGPTGLSQRDASSEVSTSTVAERLQEAEATLAAYRFEQFTDLNLTDQMLRELQMRAEAAEKRAEKAERFVENERELRRAAEEQLQSALATIGKLEEHLQDATFLADPSILVGPTRTTLNHSSEIPMGTEEGQDLEGL